MEISLLTQFNLLRLRHQMDPITAAFALATEIIKNNEILFAALPDDRKAAEASQYFDAIQKTRDFVTNIVNLFHKP